MNPLRSTSLSRSISSGETKTVVSLLIVMPGGRLNFSRIFRIVSVFLVRQTMVSRMLLLFMSAEVSVRLDFPEPYPFQIPRPGVVSLGHGVVFGQFAAFQIALRGLAAFQCGQFLCPLGEELLEEGVAYAAGVEGGVGVVVHSGLVAGEEEHQLGQLVGAHFGGEGVGKNADAVCQSLVRLAACAEQGGDLQVYPVGGGAGAVEAVHVAQHGAGCGVCLGGVLRGVAPMGGVVGAAHVRRAWVSGLEGRCYDAAFALAGR